jgi:ArsR family transcriptional regulator
MVSAMAHPVRLAILDELARGERSAGDLVLALRLPQPQVSQHLTVLRSAGVVMRRRSANRQIYRLADPMIARACGMMSAVVDQLSRAERERLRAPAPA